MAGLCSGRRWESSPFFSHGCQLPQQLPKPHRSALPKSTENRENPPERKTNRGACGRTQSEAPCPELGMSPQPWGRVLSPKSPPKSKRQPLPS